MGNSQEERTDIFERVKPTLLGGAISEHLYNLQFLDTANNPNAPKHTTGWWHASACKEDGRTVHYMFLLKANNEPLDDMEKRAWTTFSNLENPRYECWKVQHSHNGESSWKLMHGDERISLDDFKKRLKRISKNSLSNNNEGQCNKLEVQFQERAIDYFRERDLETAVSESLKMSDMLSTMLNEGYLQSCENLDCITDEEGLTVVEIKFKGEMQEGFFGINIGEAKTLETLSRQGLRVKMCILFKPRYLDEAFKRVKKRHISILDYIEMQGLDRQWLTVTLDDMKKSVDEEVRYSSVEESFDESHPQAYRAIKIPLCCYEHVKAQFYDEVEYSA